MRALGLAVVLALALLLVGCEDESAPPQEPVITLAKVDGWRDPVFRATEAWREQKGPPFGVLEIAFDDATAETAWNENVPEGLPEQTDRPLEPGVYGHLDEVNFQTHAVVVWSSGQSGSCPGWLADVRMTGDGEVTAHLGEHVPGNACTDDYQPYRMVLAVSRERLPGPEDLPTSMELEGRLSALATTYPFDPAFGVAE